MYAPPPAKQRDELLRDIIGDLSQDPAVVGIFLSGSLAADTADAHSDIDLRVVVTLAKIAEYCANRLLRPRRWRGFLFNEWGDDETCCVSHFENFAKVDVYYIDADHVKDWLPPTSPIRVLHDPGGVIHAARQCAVVGHDSDTSVAVERAVGKATAYAIEAARRLARGELMYVQSQLDGLRNRLVVLEDLLESRSPGINCSSRLERRISPSLLRSLYAACVPTEPVALQAALIDLARVCSALVSRLHERSLLTSSPEAFLNVLNQLAADNA